MRPPRLLFPLIGLCAFSSAHAADSLFYIEAQGVIGYSSMHKTVYRSAMPDDVMQLNSIGFDYIKKLSSPTQDFGTAALQARLAYNQDKNKAELQLYNAFFKFKTAAADFWVGHDRIAYGLASFWDTHGDLLQPLPMYGFGFDRDWGIGVSKDFERGDVKSAITTGTGMGIRTHGNWLFSSRASYGVLNSDNYNIGLSFVGGKILDTMGYQVMNPSPKNLIMGGVDFSYNHDNIEHKAELTFGKKNKRNALGAFYRIGFNLMEENRLKIEGQWVYTQSEGQSDSALAAGVSFRINADVTARVMFERLRNMNDRRAIAQIYYYFGV